MTLVRRDFQYLLARDTFISAILSKRISCTYTGCSLGCGIVVRKEILRLPEMPQFQKLSYFCSRFPISLAKRFASFLYPVYNHPVGFVHRVHVEGGKVDPRDPFRGMSQAVADDRKRNLLALGQARPRMPRHVHRQRHLQA